MTEETMLNAETITITAYEAFKDTHNMSWYHVDRDVIERHGRSISWANLYVDEWRSQKYRPFDPENDVRVVLFDSTCWGDQSGSTWTRSNHRCLLRDFTREDGEDFWVSVDQYHPEWRTLGLLATDEIRIDVADMLNGLAEEYPIYDEEDEAKLIDQLATEAWDEYLSMDTMNQLGREHGIPDDVLDEIDDAWLRERYYALTSERPESPRGETAMNVVFPYNNDVVKAIADEIRKGKAKK